MPAASRATIVVCIRRGYVGPVFMQRSSTIMREASHDRLRRTGQSTEWQQELIQFVSFRQRNAGLFADTADNARVIPSG